MIYPKGIYLLVIILLFTFPFTFLYNEYMKYLNMPLGYTNITNEIILFIISKIFEIFTLYVINSKYGKHFINNISQVFIFKIITFMLSFLYLFV